MMTSWFLVGSLWLSIALGVALLILPARLVSAESDRISYRELVERRPHLEKWIYLRELLLIPVIGVSAVYPMFLGAADVSYGVLLFGGLAFVVGLVELSTGLAFLNGFGGRFLGRQTLVLSTRARQVGLARSALALLLIEICRLVDGSWP